MLKMKSIILFVREKTLWIAINHKIKQLNTYIVSMQKFHKHTIDMKCCKLLLGILCCSIIVDYK